MNNKADTKDAEYRNLMERARELTSQATSQSRMLVQQLKELQVLMEEMGERDK